MVIFMCGRILHILAYLFSFRFQEKQGDITEDETVRFKSYLLSLGIDDPVTRGAFSSENDYYRNLAQQLVQMLLEPIKVSIQNFISLLTAHCQLVFSFASQTRFVGLLYTQDLSFFYGVVESEIRCLALEIHIICFV